MASRWRSNREGGQLVLPELVYGGKWKSKVFAFYSRGGGGVEKFLTATLVYAAKINYPCQTGETPLLMPFVFNEEGGSKFSGNLGNIGGSKVFKRVLSGLETCQKNPPLCLNGSHRISVNYLWQISETPRPRRRAAALGKVLERGGCDAVAV